MRAIKSLYGTTLTGPLAAAALPFDAIDLGELGSGEDVAAFRLLAGDRILLSFMASSAEIPEVCFRTSAFPPPPPLYPLPPDVDRPNVRPAVLVVVVLVMLPELGLARRDLDTMPSLSR